MGNSAGQPQGRPGEKVLAGTLLDLLGSPELVKRVKECFEEENKGVKYEPLLPPDTRSPLDLNKQMMDMYRPEMKKRYLNKTVKFEWESTPPQELSCNSANYPPTAKGGS